MSWYAFEEIEEAAKRSRELLLPFDWKLWARIAVIAFFAGGIVIPAGTTGDFSVGADLQDVNLVDRGPQLGSNIILLGAILLGFLGLLYGVVSSVFSFVYYQSLLDDEVRIRKNFVKHFFNGSKLFVFEVSALLVFFAAAALLVLPVFLTPVFLILTFLLGIPLSILFIVFFSFVSDFVPLFVIEKNQGILESVENLIQVSLDEWRQLGLYFIVKALLSGLAQMVVGGASLIILLLLVIPAGFVAWLFYLIFKPLAVLVLVLGFLVWMTGVIYFVNGPVTTFFRYYSILVYDDVTQVESAEN